MSESVVRPGEPDHRFLDSAGADVARKIMRDALRQHRESCRSCSADLPGDDEAATRCLDCAVTAVGEAAIVLLGSGPALEWRDLVLVGILGRVQSARMALVVFQEPGAFLQVLVRLVSEASDALESAPVEVATRAAVVDEAVGLLSDRLWEVAALGRSLADPGVLCVELRSLADWLGCQPGERWRTGDFTFPLPSDLQISVPVFGRRFLP